MKLRLLRFLFALSVVVIGGTCQKAQAQLFEKRENPKFKQNPKHTWSWFNRKKYWSIGGSIGAMNYFGDIVPQPYFTSMDLGYTRPHIALHAVKRYRPNFSVRYALSWGRVKGDDTVAVEQDKRRWEHNQFRYIRNLRFRNDILELSAVGIWDFIGNRGTFYQRPKRVIPYLVGGIAIFRHNPKAPSPAEFGGHWVALQPLGTEGQGHDEKYGRKYSRWQIGIPMGFGMRYRIATRWDIAFEISYRKLFTDYIDDVSRKYVDLGVFGDNDLARAMSDRSLEGGRRIDQLGLTFRPEYYTYVGVDGRVYRTLVGFGNEQFEDNIRGNYRDKDVLITAGIHVNYIIPGQVRCPEPFKKRFRRHRL
ncbi:MAG: hypothetical protein RMJ44_00730 [Cytophagales bacterium]|nr:hypothetical protein [Bernardetiaceae bacterium]MDW8209584.1 hypothetical protein [Cytophagales bacterium]